LVLASNSLPAMPPDLSAETLRFVRQLAADVNAPGLELPCYPQVALRVQEALADANVDLNQLARLIGCDPVLAARILALANSVVFNSTGSPITDLRSAVARMGVDTLRSAAIGFAVAQLRKSSEYEPIVKPLAALWEESVNTAALSYILADHTRRCRPDVAMLAGLVSNIGKLYILTKSSQFPILFAHTERYQEIVQQWHAQIARSILENWRMVDEIIEAVAQVDEAPLDSRGRVSTSDVLAAAHLLVRLKAQPEDLEGALPQHQAAMRLGLDANACRGLLERCAAEVASLRDSLT
jgi:HD-like signal output (HDOD) protein